MPPDVLNAATAQDQAAAWFSHLRSGEASPEDWRAFEQWRQSDQEHDRCYRHLEAIWQATLQIPESELRAALRASRPSTPVNKPRRRFAWGMTAGLCAAGVLAAVGIRASLDAEPSYQTTLTTPRGLHEELRLPDGSTLMANTGTRAQIRFYENERVVDLYAGEVFFDVQPDRSRPFVVHAGQSRVVVTGTRFNVLHEQQQLQVTVESGSVKVQQGAWWDRDTRLLERGQSVYTAEDAPLGQVEKADLDTSLAWRNGMIVFENTPLEQAVAQINRYLPQAAVFDAPRFASYKVAGVFSVNEPLALIHTLPDLVPVKIQTLPSGQLRISE